jgi:uncharacterized membrane protein
VNLVSFSKRANYLMYHYTLMLYYLLCGIGVGLLSIYMNFRNGNSPASFIAPAVLISVGIIGVLRKRYDLFMHSQEDRKFTESAGYAEYSLRDGEKTAG